MMESTVLEVSHGGHCIIEINGKLISNYIQAPLGITWNGALQYTFSPGTYKIRMSIGRGSLPGPISHTWSVKKSYNNIIIETQQPIALLNLLNY